MSIIEPVSTDWLDLLALTDHGAMRVADEDIDITLVYLILHGVVTYENGIIRETK